MEELDIDSELNDNEEDIVEVKDLNNKVVIKDKKGNIKYKYPFRMYFGHDYRDVSHIFEKEKEYSEKDIINLLKKGELLVIPIKELNSKHLSGVHHNIRTVKIEDLKKDYSKMKFPKRYKNLIHKK